MFVPHKGNELLRMVDKTHEKDTFLDMTEDFNCVLQFNQKFSFKTEWNETSKMKQSKKYETKLVCCFFDFFSSHDDAF